MRRVWKYCFLFAFSVLACDRASGQDAVSPKHAVLVLIIDQPGRQFARDMLEGIQEATRDAIDITLFIEFSGPTALESREVEIQRQKLRMARYAGQPIEIIVAIGDRVLADATQLRDELFPSAKLIFGTETPRNIPPQIRQGEGFAVDVNPFPSLRVALSLLPKISNLIVIGGLSDRDEAIRQSFIRDANTLEPKRKLIFLSGVPLSELRDQAADFPENSLIVLTSGMVDRSGRATTLVDQARELSKTAKVPIIDGADLSLNYGAIGGDVVSLKLTGVEMGRRIRHALETGEAPPGVVMIPAPRRRVLDWRQLQRFGVAESSLPGGFEILNRPPTLWEEHRTAILAVIAGLILQTILISFLLTERRRRAAVQARMKRQLELEAMVSKASADLATATPEELPQRLSAVSFGLSECLGLERVSVWIYSAEEKDYVPVHWWPESRLPAVARIVQRLPYLDHELHAGRPVTFARVEDLPPEAASDVATLNDVGIKSGSMIPLKLGDEPIGAILLGMYSRETDWDSEAISTLQVLANILAQAISRSLAEQRARRTEAENAQNRQTIWHLNRVAALGELTASLAHEINQPLAAILNSAEAAAALLSRPSPDISETLEAISDIIEDDKRAGSVIRKMRSMLKHGYEGTQAVDLDAAVRETLRLVMNEARLRHVTLRHISNPGLSAIVVDPTQLQQVIINLVTNGIEATEAMVDHRIVEIKTSFSAVDGMQILEVLDNGPGIPAEKLRAIFEPFYTSKREGLGLGLPICRSIVESFGGKITAENRPDRGAVFRVFLRPFASAYDKSEAAQAGD